MGKRIEITGLTWDHPRAFEGLFRETESFNASNENFSIKWELHSLRGFEAAPISETAEKYDLIILDHPFMGDAASQSAVLDLSRFLEPSVLGKLRDSYVGPSFESYEYEGGLWALPIDAASQVSAYRPDLIEGEIPRTLQEAIEFGRQRGLGLAMANPHAFMNYLGIASLLGADISGCEDNFLPQDIALESLSILAELARNLPKKAYNWSSIDLLDAMVETDQIAYCPMVFSFCTYAQTFSEHYSLRFGDIPTVEPLAETHGVLGGAGLAVSARTAHRNEAIEAALHFVGDGAQWRMAQNGAQPAHRRVWSDGAAETPSGLFFKDCRAMQLGAKIRPRWPHYIELQNYCGALLREDLLRGTRPLRETMRDIELNFRRLRGSGI